MPSKPAARPPKPKFFRTAVEFRDWLKKNGEKEIELWMGYWKKSSGKGGLTYKDALDEALCYGWIDSLVKRIDDDRYAQKFTPRRPESNWSTANIKRYAALKAANRLAAPGLERSPEGRPVVDGPPPESLPSAEARRDAESALQKDAAAWKSFQALAPSHRRRYISWIAMAKREETREKRVREAMTMLRKGRALGLK